MSIDQQIQSINTSMSEEDLHTKLTKFSLRGSSNDLEKRAHIQVPILGKLALRGQATTIYAEPNLGKTLITLSLLMASIDRGDFDPHQLYYINMDDDGTGLAGKTRISEEYKFEVLSDGHRGFSVKEFFSAIKTSVDAGQPQDAIIVLDTLKKFVDTMDKKATRAFGSLMRAFVSLGGTVIALSHTNKKKDGNGSSIYTGTSDIVEDFDCIYIADEIRQEGNKPNKLVVFKNKKRRGAVVDRAVYSYASGADVSYDVKLASVEEVEGSHEWFEPDERTASEEKIIEAIEACIREAVDLQKIRLRNTAAARAGVSQQAAQRVLEKYTGEDPKSHRWTFSVGARGAKTFVLLARPSEAPGRSAVVTPSNNWPNGHDPDF